MAKKKKREKKNPRKFEEKITIFCHLGQLINYFYVALLSNINKMN